MVGWSVPAVSFQAIENMGCTMQLCQNSTGLWQTGQMDWQKELYEVQQQDMQGPARENAWAGFFKPLI